MLKTPLFKSLFSTIVLIGLLHLISIKLYLYWTVFWIDNLMHFLGGFWIAVVFLWFYYFSGLFSPQRGFFRGFFISILSAFVVGFLWEVFEYKFNLTFWPEDKIDSYSDLIMDSLGGAIAFYYFYLGKNKPSYAKE